MSANVFLGIALLLAVIGQAVVPYLLQKQFMKDFRELQIRLSSKSTMEAEYFIRQEEEAKKAEKEKKAREKEYEKLSDIQKERKDKAKEF